MTLFRNLTLQIQGQGHEWDLSSRSHNGTNILLTHIPFVPCQWPPFLRGTSFFYFKSWPRKSKVKVTIQGHTVDPTSYSHSFHSMSIDPHIPEIWLFQNLTLKIQGQGHGCSKKVKVTQLAQHHLLHFLFVSCQSVQPLHVLRYDHWNVSLWKKNKNKKPRKFEKKIVPKIFCNRNPPNFNQFIPKMLLLAWLLQIMLPLVTDQVAFNSMCPSDTIDLDQYWLS